MDAEQFFYKEASNSCYRQKHKPDAAENAQAGVEKAIEFQIIFGCAELGDVPYDRRADSEVKQAIVSCDRKNQDPESEGFVSQFVKNVGRDDNARRNIDDEPQPAGTDVLDDPDFFESFHESMGISLLENLLNYQRRGVAV